MSRSLIILILAAFTLTPGLAQANPVSDLAFDPATDIEIWLIKHSYNSRFNPNGTLDDRLEGRIQDFADEFWEHYKKIQQLLPPDLNKIAISGHAYRADVLAPLQHHYTETSRVLSKITALALYDLRYLDASTKTLLATIEATKQFRLNRVKTFFTLIGGAVVFFVGASFPPSLPIVTTMLTSVAASGVSATILAEQKNFHLLSPSQKKVARRYEKFLEARFEAIWNAFFKQLEVKHGLELKGWRFNKKFQAFQTWTQTAFKLKELTQLGLLPATLCEAIGFLPKRDGILALPPALNPTK